MPSSAGYARLETRPASVADEAVSLLAGSELKKDADLLKKELRGVVKKEALAAVLAVTKGIPVFGQCT